MPKKNRDVRAVGHRKATDIVALTLAVVRLAEQLKVETEPNTKTKTDSSDEPTTPEAA